ncbi:alpha/beta-hydrolase [Ramaria rubella]|nr:alpha/beta-hydrolase [Ramaria rubella]
MAYTATYGNEDLDLYHAPTADIKPLIVYVHGGAWRSESKERHAGLAVRIRDRTGCPVAVLDYRLTVSLNCASIWPRCTRRGYARGVHCMCARVHAARSSARSAVARLPLTHPQNSTNELKHPAHAKDVLAALHFLLAWPDGPPFDPTRLYLIGHSAGAHILTSIFLDAAPAFSPLSPDNAPLRPSPALLAAVQGIALSSGIYDLTALIASFPAYDGAFVKAAFRTPYASWNTARYPLHADAHPVRWHIIHSSGDTLVDIPQSRAIYDHLRQLYARKGWDQERISKDWDTLSTGHYYFDHSPYADLVSDWVTSDIQKYF